MQKLLVAQWFEQWQLKPETLSTIPADGIWHFIFLLFPTQNVVSVNVTFVGVLVEWKKNIKSRTSTCNAYFHHCV